MAKNIAQLVGATLLLAIMAAGTVVANVALAVLMMGGPASAGITPDPSAPAVAKVWCAVPLEHGSHCLWAKGVGIIAGHYSTGPGHKFRLTRVHGRFEGRPQYQFRIAGRAGKCLGTNASIPLGMVQPCGPGGAGTVFVFHGTNIVSRYWTVHNGGAGDPNWDLTDSAYHDLIRFRPEGIPSASQFWSVCNRAVCGIQGGTPT